MCGRYTLTTPAEDLTEVFGVEEPSFELEPRYNICPTQRAPVVARRRDRRRMGLLQWGLVPHWAEDPSIGRRLVNARSESVARAPAFREAFRGRRCLVPADGFYEWKARGGGPKTPHWVHRPDRRPFAMAGLWARWTDPDDRDRPLHTFSILTRDAVPELRDLHERMPVLLDEEGRRIWLDPASGAEALAGALARPPGPLRFHAVSRRVNRPAHDGPECIEPVEEG